MSIQDSDKLLIGRDNTSYQISLDQSGLATEGYVDAIADNVVMKTGDTMTGSLNFTANTDINLVGNNTGVNLEAGYWGALKYDGDLQLEWGAEGLKIGRDINMKAGNVALNVQAAEAQYLSDTDPEHFRGHAIHWLKAPEHKYDATNKQYVDNAIADNTPDLTGYATETYVDAGDALALPKLGATVSSTSDVNFTYNKSLNFNSLESVRLAADGKIRLDGDEGIDLVTDSSPIRIYGNTVISGSLSLSDNKINNVGTPTTAKDATNKQYVDDAIANLGDVLTFKGTVDFTTDAAPANPLVGDVYANTGTGAADASWGLAGDVAPGEMYGRGESQWGLIGSSQVDLTGYATETYVDAGDALALPKLGDTVNSTSDVEFRYYKGLKFISHRSLDFSADYKISLYGDDEVVLSTDAGRIKLQSETVISSGPLKLSNQKIREVGTPTAASDATTKQYVDDNFLGLNFNNLPALS